MYVSTFGGLNIYPYQDRQNPIKVRSKKERELFAFLLDTGNSGATKEQIYNAIWSETESENVKRLMFFLLLHCRQMPQECRPQQLYFSYCFYHSIYTPKFFIKTEILFVHA
jgi:two-component SAPR family response regulator